VEVLAGLSPATIRRLLRRHHPNSSIALVRWTLRNDDGEMDQGLREVEEGLAEVIAEIEGEL